MPLKPVPVVGAFLTLAVLYLVGVMTFYGPIAAQDVAGDPVVPRLMGLAISIVVYIGLFVWVEAEMGSSLKAAMAVALSQLALVDIDYVLSGDRGVAAAAASAVLLLVSWCATGWVYGRLKRSALLATDT